MNLGTTVRTEDFQAAADHLLAVLRGFKQCTDGHLHIVDRRVFGPVTPLVIDRKVCGALRRAFGDRLPDGQTPIPYLLDEQLPWSAARIRNHVLHGTHVPFIVKMNASGSTAAANLPHMLTLLLDYGVDEESRVTLGKHAFGLSSFKAKRDEPDASAHNKMARRLRRAFLAWPTRSTRAMVIDATVDFGQMARTLGPYRRMCVRNYLVSFHHMPVDIARLLVA